MKSFNVYKQNLTWSEPFYRSDAHLHLDQDSALASCLRQGQILNLVNCQSAQEWQVNHHLLGQGDHQYYSFGIHPWEADRLAPNLLPYYQAADVIGEIGLDQVWTDQPYHVQLATFRQQIQLAQSLNKPVILHTKGYEDRVLAEIQAYDLVYYIHWYSSSKYLEDYLALDTYFSIGPDLKTNPAVQALARRIPDDRLLLESDGLASLAWVQGQKTFPLAKYLDYFQLISQKLARLRGSSPQHIQKLAWQNLMNFIQGRPPTPIH